MGKTMIKDGTHGYSREDEWVKPESPELQERLEWFRDQKLGIMMHWGPHSLLGMFESWGLSDEDAHWSRGPVDWTDGEEFKKQYFALNKAFYPVRFQPDVWADLAADNGFKYLIFTTKHHDGFCMWDTETTDYKSTSPEVPFSEHRYADICKHLFNAFRERGLAISAYFSKADWHTKTYWAPGMERSQPTWRGPSYNPAEHPRLWDEFVNFSHEQIMELMTKYGRIDVLWLDAGWVRADNGQDIRLGEVVAAAREHQPWLLTADRTVGGAHENFITPEQAIPEQHMSVPWESCITMGAGFSYRYEGEYKSTRTLIHILMEVVAKGGNLALNIAPQPDGRLPEAAVKRMKELGDWLKLYGEGVYGTRSCEPYFAQECAFTRKGSTVYCFRLYPEGAEVDEIIRFPFNESIQSIELIDPEERLMFTMEDGRVSVVLPPGECARSAPIAHVLRLTLRNEDNS
ncbi:alpha-L-fucosidase [Paenibacillus sp. SAF-054]|uniref:alpha-L-fucosidase n=1 Tax=unclassified Paenibacillus TaxID=185978 RepID=UPI003F812E8A